MIRSLIERAPRHAYTVYPSFGDFYFDPRMAWARGYRGRDVRSGPRHLTRAAASRFWNDPRLEARLGHPDVVHSNNFWCPVQLSRTRLVYTCYDLSFAIHPEWTTEANRVGCFDGMFRAAAVADWVVAISKATRRDFLATFPHFPAERVRVVYPAARFEAHAMRGERPNAAARLEPGAFWLSVGTVEPRKNQERLARAYARYRALGGAPMPLVLAGGSGWLMEGFEQHLAGLGVRDDVVLTGYVSDAELAWLYAHCHANLYASRFEGFGLPVLEGMQLGAPTLSSNATSLPEVAGDAAILLPPDDEEAWAQAMLALSRDPARRAQLAQAARARARRFDRHASADALLALYEDALAAPRRAGETMAAP